MGFFDFFSKKNKPQVAVAAVAVPGNPLLDAVEVKPGVNIARAFVQDWPALEASRLDYVAIEAVPVESMKLEQSKFGHYPKIPAGFDYPVDNTGHFMYPLAQINFNEIPPLPGYPATGLLQFYISVHDETYGLDFTGSLGDKNYRVHYFEEQELENCRTDFSFLQDIITTDMSPVYKPHALYFSAKEEYFGMGDVRYEDNAGKIVNRVLDKYPDIKDDLQESLYEDFPSNGHKIGGYAYFTQSDPREYDEDVKDYILLLQIDSDTEIMWGDVGVANFFIHPDDLAKKDFSKVFYSWDCC
jgi:uncharacterized protein YwqG